MRKFFSINTPEQNKIEILWNLRKFKWILFVTFKFFQ